MGEKQTFQPLTREDRVSVILYRTGIVLSSIFLAILAFLIASQPGSRLFAEVLGYGLYISVGMSVFFIHLYIGKFKVFLKRLYFISLGALAVLLFIGQGSLSTAFVQAQYTYLLLLPLAGCLGFVTAKEAFCFKLLEGYVLAMIMPIYLVLLAGSAIAGSTAVAGLVLIAALLVLFTLRKAFMPLAYDIGDKSAYQ